LAGAIAALQAGELVVFPTETVYGLGADPKRPQALRRVYALKGREPDKPVALIAADAASAFALASEVPADARLLARAFWPGPLTLVLPARQGLDPAIVGPGGGVGVRVSPHPIASALARALGGAITATSANLAGAPPASTIAQARRALGARISIYLDVGPLKSNAPSTVVAFGQDGSFRILRTGVLDRSTIAAVLRREQ